MIHNRPVLNYYPGKNHCQAIQKITNMWIYMNKSKGVCVLIGAQQSKIHPRRESCFFIRNTYQICCCTERVRASSLWVKKERMDWWNNGWMHECINERNSESQTKANLKSHIGVKCDFSFLFTSTWRADPEVRHKSTSKHSILKNYQHLWRHWWDSNYGHVGSLYCPNKHSTQKVWKRVSGRSGTSLL